MIAHYNPDTHLVTIRNRHGAIMGRCEGINGGFEFVREKYYSGDITPDQWQEIEAEIARLNV